MRIACSIAPVAFFNYRGSHLIIVSALLVSTNPTVTTIAAQELVLHAELSTATPTVPMGNPVTFSLSLRLDKNSVDSNVWILDRGSWTCGFTFVNIAGGKEYHRRSLGPQLPRHRLPEDLVDMKADTAIVETVSIHLLSPEGEQIPPGTYTVSANYRNDGDEADGNSATYLENRPRAGASRCWKGEVRSEPMKLTVVSAEPSDVDFEVPTGIETFEREEDANLCWRWIADPKQIIHVRKRPGYAIGHRYVIHTRVDGQDNGSPIRGEGSIWCYPVYSCLYPPVSARESEIELIVDVEIFESSVQPGHLWRPEDGDFKVLWKGQIGGDYPSE